MKAQQSRAHHYVPQWYQRRFLTPGASRFFYLDLHPETVVRDGVSHERKALLRWGPAKCFYKDDLYTLRFGSRTTDEMERFFFGAIDSRGRTAVSEFAEFKGISKGAADAFRDMSPYMGAQRFRTPRGLDFIRKLSRSVDHNATLVALQGVFQGYTTMWAEGVWEIARARHSPTKFIVTDEPVTFFNRRAFPSEMTHPYDVGLEAVGTRTLFPLGLDSCLIITHVQLVRDLWLKPLVPRVNARFYDQVLKHIGDIQFDRELEEDEVLRINYIFKRRATRYLAAAEEEWLYPERRASIKEWGKLDDDWFLLPHLWKVSFSGGIVAGSRGGPAFAADEYGRHPGDPMYQDKSLRDKEWVTHELAQRAWAKRRVGKSVAQTDRRGRGDVADQMMREYLQEEGLLPVSEPKSVSEQK
jgi:hypothetical protein